MVPTYFSYMIKIKENEKNVMCKLKIYSIELFKSRKTADIHRTLYYKTILRSVSRYHRIRAIYTYIAILLLYIHMHILHIDERMVVCVFFTLPIGT